MIDAHNEEVRREAWQRLINEELLEWLRDPAQLEDDGIDAPTATIVRLSLDLAERFRDAGFPAPDSIVTDPNGGIVFERREGNVSEVLHVWDDGSVEYMLFHGTQLAERQPLDVDSTSYEGNGSVEYSSDFLSQAVACAA